VQNDAIIDYQHWMNSEATSNAAAGRVDEIAQQNIFLTNQRYGRKVEVIKRNQIALKKW
jgi:hypothetical protein